MSDTVEKKVDEVTSSSITRRRFIMGVIAGGAVVGAASYGILSPHHAALPSENAGERLLTLNVNGKLRRADVMKQETLSNTLRYKLGLTGTKNGCDRAECGSCTVLIDGVPHYSCSVLTHTVRGRKIVTIEGLASPNGKLHPVQQAIVDEQGFQCAFCMSGFTMAAVGFLNQNPNPTRAEMAHGVSGNLCRCQDYSKILDALMRGAEYMKTGGPAAKPAASERRA
jgi:aerobic-type carbon monoxide dehydrogenase small subunit (CoxS/CutS family)